MGCRGLEPVVLWKRSLTYNWCIALSFQIIKLLAAIRTLPIEQSQPWKAQTRFWMDRIPLERAPLQSAPWLQWERVTACLQFRMVAGVQPVLQHLRPLTSMENLQPAGQTVKVEEGLIRFMSSKVSQRIINPRESVDDLFKCRLVVLLSPMWYVWYRPHDMSVILKKRNNQRWRNNIALTFPNVIPFTASSLHYETIGCFQDRSSRAIPTLEGQDSILDGSYIAREDPIEKCYQAAKKRGFHVFAVQNGGWCAASSSAAKTFDKYGKSSACKSDGEGGPGANQVYIIKGKRTVICSTQPEDQIKDMLCLTN